MFGKQSALQTRSYNLRTEAIESYFMQELKDITFDLELVDIVYQAKLEELNAEGTLNVQKQIEQLEHSVSTIEQKKTKLNDFMNERKYFR